MLARILFGGIAVVCLVLVLLLLVSKSTLNGDVVLVIALALIGVEAVAHLLPPAP